MRLSVAWPKSRNTRLQNALVKENKQSFSQSAEINGLGLCLDMEVKNEAK